MHLWNFSSCGNSLIFRCFWNKNKILTSLGSALPEENSEVHHTLCLAIFTLCPYKKWCDCLRISVFSIGVDLSHDHWQIHVSWVDLSIFKADTTFHQLPVSDELLYLTADFSVLTRILCNGTYILFMLFCKALDF